MSSSQDSTEQALNPESSDIKDQKIENERFTKHSPLITLLLMSIGPLSLLVSAVGETIDMFLVSKRFNKEDPHVIQILGFMGTPIQTLSYIGLFFGQCITSRLTNLISAGKREDACQLTADIFRISFVFSIIFSIIFYFICKPFLLFCGCPRDLLQGCFDMSKPCIYMAFLLTWYLAGINFIQAIGRSMLSAGIKCLTYVFQLGLTTPLLLFAFKVPSSQIKWAGQIANSIVSVSLFVLIFSGKFDLKPTWKRLVGKFTKESGRALLLASPMIFQFICYILPPIFVIQSCAHAAGTEANLIGGVFAVISRLTAISAAFSTAIDFAFLSCGTHSFGCGDFKRLFRFYIYSLAIGVAIMLVISPVMLFCPEKIGKVFLSSEAEIQLAKKMIPIPFYTMLLQPLFVCSSMMLVVLGKPIFALVGAAIQAIVQCGGCKILGKIFKNNPINIMYVYTCSDIFTFVVYALLMIKPLLDLRKSIRTQGESVLATGSGEESMYESLT